MVSNVCFLLNERGAFLKEPTFLKNLELAYSVGFGWTQNSLASVLGCDDDDSLPTHIQGKVSLIRRME